MRILHLNTHASGGSYEYAALLCSALAEQGIEGRVFSKSSQPAEGRRPFLDRVVRRLYVSLSTEPWHGTRRLLAPPAARGLAGVDVIHLHTVADWFDVPHWLQTVPSGIGFVISIHDMWHITGGCFLYRGCDRYGNTCTPCPILLPPLNRVLARDELRRKLHAYQSRRVRVVANSQWLARLAEQSPVVRACGGVNVIAPGIDTDIFTMQNKAECRAKLEIAQNAFVIAAGAVSLTDTNKNIRWLLEQLAKLPKFENGIVLLAGEGAVQIPAELNVRLMGGITDRRARAVFFGAADVFVSASLMETYGLSLVEAMACGRPVVAFRVGGVPEAAPDGQGAILCDPGDAAALREAITNLYESRQLRVELGQLAHQTTQARHAATAFAGKFAELYRECMGIGQTNYTNKTATTP